MNYDRRAPAWRDRNHSESPSVGASFEDHEKLVSATQSYLVARLSRKSPSQGEKFAWDRFYEFYDPHVRRVVSACGVTSLNFEDCVQAAWHEIIQKLPRLSFDPGHRTLVPWLNVLVKRKIWALSRQNQRERGLRELELRDLPCHRLQAPDAVASQREQLSHLGHALGLLRQQVTQTNFQIFCLHWLKDKTYAEISATLELSAAEARYRQHRVKRRFKRVWSLHLKRARRNAPIVRITKTPQHASYRRVRCASN